MKTLFKTALIIVAITSLAYAQEGQARLSPSEINSLASVNAGAGTSGVNGIQTRTLKGDASKLGIYTIQLTIPAGVRIQAHTHPDDRVATVISGTWYIGYGAKFDEAKLKALTAIGPCQGNKIPFRPLADGRETGRDRCSLEGLFR
jgi:hypothetical protein